MRISDADLEKIEKMLDGYLATSHDALNSVNGEHLTPVKEYVAISYYAVDKGTHSQHTYNYPIISFLESTDIHIALDFNIHGRIPFDLTKYKPHICLGTIHGSYIIFNKKYKSPKSYASAMKQLAKKRLTSKDIKPLVKNGRRWVGGSKQQTSVDAEVGDVVMYSTEFYVIESWVADEDHPSSRKEVIITVVSILTGIKVSFKAKQLYGGLEIGTSIKQVLKRHPEDIPLYANSPDPIARVLAMDMLGY